MAEIGKQQVGHYSKKKYSLPVIPRAKTRLTKWKQKHLENENYRIRARFIYGAAKPSLW